MPADASAHEQAASAPKPMGPAGPRRSPRLLPVVVGVLFAVYPLLVWIGLASRSPREVAIVLLCLLVPL